MPEALEAVFRLRLDAVAGEDPVRLGRFALEEPLEVPLRSPAV